MKSKSIAALFIASALFLAGCTAQSNTLTFTTPAPITGQNMIQNAIVMVQTKDSRPTQTIASYTKMGELIKLNANPSISQLFQQLMQQNLVSKGFRIGFANEANAGVTVDVRDFSANVEQGNLRYNINSKIQAVVYVQGPKGNFNKVFNATRSQSGALSASNEDIQKILSATFNDLANSIYQDNEIGAAINQYVD